MTGMSPDARALVYRHQALRCKPSTAPDRVRPVCGRTGRERLQPSSRIRMPTKSLWEPQSLLLLEALDDLGNLMKFSS